jgi:hypothetical protein
MPQQLRLRHDSLECDTMQRSEWDFDNTADRDETDAPEPKSPEALADQFGIRTALLVLCIASFIAAIWLEPISKLLAAVDPI